ncbi:MAG: hypothetical protein MJK04_26865 [Psychrosphaera sp.]|nr:hypothetical protein [Psychrosphaera sp.]
MSIIHLVKANDDLVSHCKCQQGIVGEPGQMDCPWCGCGWLFSCSNCRKAFTFAIAVEIDKTWEELALQDLYSYNKQTPDATSIADWIENMKAMTGHIELGQSYVYLDGAFIPADMQDFKLSGWKTTHKFDTTPQIAALEEPSVIEHILSNPDYWRKDEPGQAKMH